MLAADAVSSSAPIELTSSKGSSLQCRMLVTLLTVLFYYFPSILTTTLSLFTCYRLDRPATFANYPGNAQVSLHVAMTVYENEGVNACTVRKPLQSGRVMLW